MRRELGAKGGWKKRYRRAADPAGRAKALAACGKANRLSRVAQARAKKEAQFEVFVLALADNVRFFSDLRKHQQSYAKGRPSGRQPSDLMIRIAGLLLNNVEWSQRRVEHLMTALHAMFPKGAARALRVPAVPAVPAPVQPRFDPDDYRAYGPPPRR